MSDEEAIASISNLYVDAARANDPEALVSSCHAPGAVVMPPNMEPLIGEEAIQSFLEHLTFKSFDLGVDELEITGDWAFRRGTYEMTVQLVDSDQEVQDNGKFIEIWRRQPDGGWRIARDIWNSSNPSE